VDFVGLTIVITLALLGLGSLVVWIRKQRKYSRLYGGDDNIDGAEPCLACGHQPLVEVHADAYRCPSCQYEQGPGWQRRRDEKRLEELMMMGPEEAAAVARAKLQEARSMTLAAAPTLERPITRTDRNEFDVAPGLLDAVGLVVSAWTEVQEASMLDSDVRAALLQNGFDATAPAPDTGRIVEPWTEGNIKAQARWLRQEAMVLRGAVEATMERLAIDSL
jgi:hypothetical protein